MWQLTHVSLTQLPTLSIRTFVDPCGSWHEPQRGLAHFDLIISDMGRGANMRAGYELLEAVRRTRKDIPFLIFAGSDSRKFRQEGKERGALLSTNDMLELFDTVVQTLGDRDS